MTNCDEASLDTLGMIAAMGKDTDEVVLSYDHFWNVWDCTIQDYIGTCKAYASDVSLPVAVSKCYEKWKGLDNE